MKYEYGIWATRTNDLHRENMTKAQAEDWVREWVEDVAPGGNHEAFVVCRRPIGNWEVRIDGAFYVPTRS